MINDSWVKDPAMSVLAVFGCLKVLLVNVVTQFSVAAVYEESKRPLELFSLVPSTSYSKEVGTESLDMIHSNQ